MPPAAKMSTAACGNSRYKMGMTETSEEKPDKPARRPAQRQPTASEAERLERQAEALRANLRRRKEQSRARQAPDGDC